MHCLAQKAFEINTNGLRFSLFCVWASARERVCYFLVNNRQWKLCWIAYDALAMLARFYSFHHHHRRATMCLSIRTIPLKSNDNDYSVDDDDDDLETFIRSLSLLNQNYLHLSLFRSLSVYVCESLFLYMPVCLLLLLVLFLCLFCLLKCVWIECDKFL